MIAQITKKHIVMLTFFSLLSVSSFATSTIASDCPKRFIAEVLSVESENILIQSALAKLNVKLKTSEVIAGEVEDQEEIQILKYGPISLEKGDKVEVHLRGSSICFLDKTTHGDE